MTAAGPEPVPPILAAHKNAEAQRLIASGKLRDALRVLNEAIYASPDYPHSYANRAVVFERLGMAPQAEGDRRRARDLVEAGGYSEAEVFAQPSPTRARHRPRAPRPPALRESRPRQQRRFRGIPETAVVLLALAGLAATAGGLYLAADTLRGADINLNIFEFDSFQSSESDATSTAEPTPSPEPTAPPVTPPPEALAGNPYSFATLQDTWKAKGIEASLGSVNAAFTGFTAPPFDVTLSRGGATAVFFVVIYPDRSAPSQDWNLGDQGPSPKEGRKTPAFERGWYNSNVILLLRSGNPQIVEEAKAAFLALGG